MRKYFKIYYEILKLNNITTRQKLILCLLTDTKLKNTHNETISKLLNIDKRNLIKLINDLLEKDLIYKEPKPPNSREIITTIKSHGDYFKAEINDFKCKELNKQEIILLNYLKAYSNTNKVILLSNEYLMNNLGYENERTLSRNLDDLEQKKYIERLTTIALFNGRKREIKIKAKSYFINNEKKK